MAAKLTKKQQEIVALMEQGWELGIGIDLQGHCWIQEGGIGKGGNAKDVRRATACALVDKGIVQCVSKGFPTEVYRLRK